MPSREDIAGWLREAADNFEMIGVEFLGKKTLTEYAEKMRQRAARVEAMRCEACRYYRDASASGSEWCVNEKCGPIRNQGVDFFCLRHEQKPAG